MSIFGGFGGGSLSSGNIISKEKRIPKEIEKAAQKEFNRKVEKFADKVSPEFGDTVRKFNNFTDTVENGLDAVDKLLNPPNPIEELIYDVIGFRDVQKLQPADHLYVKRIGYTHHGLYIGEGQVIHYLMDEGITIDSLETFKKGATIQLCNGAKHYTNNEIIRRAYSRLGESDYNLAFNNCEHFVEWCRNGD